MDLTNYKQTKNGFSIAEAMIVLLIVSVAMAAMAPMISKRTLRGGAGTCEWIVTANNLDIARPNSNVRVGGDGTTDPSVRFEVVSADANSDIVRIYRTGSGINLDGITDMVAKINKNGSYEPSSAAPSGMVAYFDLAACPSGWHSANGSQPGGAIKPDLRGRFIRTMDNMGGVAGNDPDVRTLGGTQTDALQGHKHDYKIKRPYGSDGGGVGLENTLGSGTWLSQANEESSNYELKGVYTDINYGTARVSTETRPKNVALLACVKD